MSAGTDAVEEALRPWRALVDFLLARVAFDEQNQLRERRVFYAESVRYDGEFYAERFDNPLAMDRRQREIESSLAIIKAGIQWDDRPVGCDTAWSEGQSCSVYDTALRSMAAVYADHPDYRQEWQA